MNRSDLTHILLHVFVFAVLCGLPSAQSDERPPGCRPGLVIDCNHNHEEIVWTIDADSQTCKIMKNRCIFNQLNCNNFKNGKPLLKETTKEECQKLCNNKCVHEPTGPVCAKRGDNLCYFGDRCMLEKHMCTKGESWGIELNRFCDEQTTASICPERQA